MRRAPPDDGRARFRARETRRSNVRATLPPPSRLSPAADPRRSLGLSLHGPSAASGRSHSLIARHGLVAGNDEGRTGRLAGCHSGGRAVGACRRPALLRRRCWPDPGLLRPRSQRRGRRPRLRLQAAAHPDRWRNHHVGPAARNGTIVSCSSHVLLSRSARSAEGEGGVPAACLPHPLCQSEGMSSVERGERPGRRVPASAAARSGGLTGLRGPGTSPCHCRSQARAGESGGPLASWAERARGKETEAGSQVDGGERAGGSTVATVRGGRFFCASV